MIKDISQNKTVYSSNNYKNKEIMKEYSPQHKKSNYKLDNERGNSPQSPVQKYNHNNIEYYEFNNKNYPSKKNVCKGHSPSSNNHYSIHSSNSPIVQYYAGMSSPSRDKRDISSYSPEENYSKGNKQYMQYHNPNTDNSGIQNYNFSPSELFNTSNNKRSSDSSVKLENENNEHSHTNGIILQEKIESNLNIARTNNIPKILPNYSSQSENNNSINEMDDYNDNLEDDNKDNDSSENENPELYMLSFDSDVEKGDDENSYEHEDNSDRNINSNKKSKNKQNPKATIILLEDKQNNSSIIKKEKIVRSKEVEEKSNINCEETPIAKVAFQEETLPIDKERNQNDKVNNYYSNLINNYYYIPKNQKPSQMILLKHAIPHQQFYMQDNDLQLQLPLHLQHYRNQQPQYYYNHQLNINIPQISQNQMQQFPNIPMTQIPIIPNTKKNKKIKRLNPESYINQPFEELAKNIVFISKDQGGCRYLQKKIEEDPKGMAIIIYPAIKMHILKLILDPFGNYLMQKIFSILKEEQLLEVLDIISSDILEIGSDSHGTRVIQEMILFLKTPKLLENFWTMIKPYIVPLLNELNGTHIIQKFCHNYPCYASFVNNNIIDNCLTLATHRHGCCVLQKYLENATEEIQQRFLVKLLANCLMLIVDQFGNYVIQSILFLRNIEAGNEIASKILENISYYSKHKYSSNVVEKCFEYCDESHKQQLIEAIARPDVTTDLILNEHGNYVVQKVLACSDEKTQNNLLKIIVPLYGKLKNLPFGERIICRLLSSHPQLNGVMTVGDGKNNRGWNNGKKNVNINSNMNINNNNINNNWQMSNNNYNMNNQGKKKNFTKKNYAAYNNSPNNMHINNSNINNLNNGNNNDGNLYNNGYYIPFSQQNNFF